MSKIWVVGQMCSGKTYYSEIIGEMFGYIPFHLDHINTRLSLIEAYTEALEHDLIEGFTPLRNDEHYMALQIAIAGRDVKHIMVAPSYEQWLENCKPIIANLTDENPPNYTKEQYELENSRIASIVNPVFIIK
jgi:hypothetical protein